MLRLPPGLRPRLPLALLCLCLAASASALGASVPASSIGLASAPSSLSFGSVALYETVNLPVELINHGKGTITIAKIASSNANFYFSGVQLPFVLAPGASVQLKASFHPQLNQSLAADFVFTTLHGYTLTLPAAGIGTLGTLLPSPAALNFGGVSLGGTRSATISLTNQANYLVTVQQISIAGAGFSVSGLDLPIKLRRGESFTFTTTFSPRVSSAALGAISVVANTIALRVPVSGSVSVASEGTLSLSPGSLSFGSVAVGASKSLSGALTASGASLTVSSASVTTSEFGLAGITLPLTIPAGHSVPFSVVFKPQSAGAAAASLSFLTSTSGVRASETVSGSGTSAATYSVALSWEASPSGVVGYNIYRGVVSGGPYSQINSTLDAQSSYTDNTVNAGKTYYYVTTAVGSNGGQSQYSNQVTATIP